MLHSRADLIWSLLMYGFGVLCVSCWDGRPDGEATGSSQVAPLGRCLSTALGSCGLFKVGRGVELPPASFEIVSLYAQVQVACHLGFTCCSRGASHTQTYVDQCCTNQGIPGLTYPFTWKSVQPPGWQTTLQESICAQVPCAEVACPLARPGLDRTCLDMRCHLRLR